VNQQSGNILFKDLDTPSLLIDETIMVTNIEKMAVAASANQVSLRPHAKTHKSAAIGRKQLEAGAVGLTLAKTSEAQTFVEKGISDIFLAYPVIGEKKIRRLLELSKQCRISAGIDSVMGAAELNEAFANSAKPLPVLLEVDTGLGRTGVGEREIAGMAEEIKKMRNLSIKGVYTYRGALLNQIKDASAPAIVETVAKQGREEAALIKRLADDLRKIGINIEVISAGSTPTALSVIAVPGVTEIRPGTYIFNDAMQVRLGACGWRDCAAKILTTVVSRPAADRAIIDGGSKVFAGDVKPETFPLNLRGCGAIIGANGLPREDIYFERMTEEHGMLVLGPTAQNLKIGERLMIVPNHICATVNLFNNLALISMENQMVKEILPVDGRGKTN